MSYQKAQHILPKELLTLLQEYAEGQYLYIPKKSVNRKSWGENTNSRQLILQRDKDIYRQYQQGECVSVLADQFYLSVKSIQRIILKEKRK